MTRVGRGTRPSPSSPALSLVATDAVLQAVRDRIGEVSATPTVNTLQDRLRAIGVQLNGGLPAALGTGGGLKASLVDLGGAATAAKQDTIIGHVDGIEALLAGTLTVTGPLTDAQLRAAAVAISAATLPLPAGAATSAKQDTLIGHVDGLEALVALLATESTLGVVSSRIGEVSATPTANTLQDRLKQIYAAVDGLEGLLAGTLAVSGPLTDVQLRAAAVAISAATLPLPAGASTEATLAALKARGDLLLAESVFTGRFGEVQASPTANTLLARVKSLEDKLGEVQASPTANTVLDRLKQLHVAVDSLENYLDGVEAYLADLQAPGSWTSGSVTAGSTNATLSNVALKHGVTLWPDPDAANAVLVGHNTTPATKLVPGSSLRLPVNNLNLVNYKRAGLADATLYYAGS